VSFSPNWSLGKIHGIVNDSATSGSDEYSHTIQQDVFLQCIPITTLLLALNVTHVDYFSLDVEGSELEVLKTIDFLKFDITVRVFVHILLKRLIFNFADAICRI
jgi:Methyltransferase FkbM domain